MMRRFSYSLMIILSGLCAPFLGQAASSTEKQNNDENIKDELHSLQLLSLAELTQVDLLTSISKTEKAAFDVASAVFVLTQDDIKRSGVTTIQDALRMVPGMNVASFNANQWGVSSRGFTGTFSSKLLVLLDGRSIYSPVFSGVFWQSIGTMLEDIDRIEVIRGPGGSLWGANAVNGIINIITKDAKQTQGGIFVSGIGTEKRGFNKVRYGGKTKDGSYYRVYAQHESTDSGQSIDTSDDTFDAAKSARAGFRIDKKLNATDSLTVHGDLFQTAGESLEDISNFKPPYDDILVESTRRAKGGYLLANWQRQINDRELWKVQMYYDAVRRTSVSLNEEVNNFDIDLQHQFSPYDNHTMVWGLNYRLTRSDLADAQVFKFSPKLRYDHLLSAFFQDEIDITDDWHLTLGSKVDYNEYTGFEIQPNIRLMWDVTKHSRLWGAISRAVRTPGRGNVDVSANLGVAPPNEAVIETPSGSFVIPAPTIIRTVGNPDIGSESVIAYELGFRQQLKNNLNWDANIFYNHYDNLIFGARITEPFCERNSERLSLETCIPHLGKPDLKFIAPFIASNKLEASSFGAEFSLDWQINKNWLVKGAYSYLKIDIDSPFQGGEVISLLETESPEHQLSLQSYFKISHNFGLNFWLRHVSKIEDNNNDADEEIIANSYTTLDVKATWQLNPDVEFSIVGQNLLERKHAEYPEEGSNFEQSAIERGVYLQVLWQF